MLNPRFVERGPLMIVGVAVRGRMGEFNYGEIWEKKYMLMDALLKPCSIDGGNYGVTLSEDDHMIYLAGVATTQPLDLPEGVERHEILAARYAVFDCLMSTMVETVQEVYGQWFHTSGLELDPNAVGFEYYPPYGGSGEMRVEINIPVRQKVNATVKPEDPSKKVFETIAKRRSIHKFKAELIPDEVLRQILQAGLLAPSGKNSQPWKFYIVQGEKRAEMVTRMRTGIHNSLREGIDIGNANFSLAVMEQAPVTVFVFNPGKKGPLLAQSIEQYLADLVDVQSIGAAIQNMLLTAEELGLGSLWVCDVFSAYEELSSWLGERSALIAAVCFGFPDEHPMARKRKPLEDMVHWL
jgi:nitroreductase/predicted transcriptional regulator YdeE